MSEWKRKKKTNRTANTQSCCLARCVWKTYKFHFEHRIYVSDIPSSGPDLIIYVCVCSLRRKQRPEGTNKLFPIFLPFARSVSIFYSTRLCTDMCTQWRRKTHTPSPDISFIFHERSSVQWNPIWNHLIQKIVVNHSCRRTCSRDFWQCWTVCVCELWPLRC